MNPQFDLTEKTVIDGGLVCRRLAVCSSALIHLRYRICFELRFNVFFLSSSSFRQLGMKTKFANHSSSDGCNATNRMVVFRGIPHIILIAKRNIRVGEEIKFDYGFRDQIPYWAKRDRQPTPESGSD